jgi:hypothetical protein
LQDPQKFTQNLDFWFENIPSGNPDLSVHITKSIINLSLPNLGNLT